MDYRNTFFFKLSDCWHNEYRISKLEKLLDYRILDNKLKLSDYRISDIKKELLIAQLC
jgi:hypothetical protein